MSSTNRFIRRPVTSIAARSGRSGRSLRGWRSRLPSASSSRRHFEGRDRVRLLGRAEELLGFRDGARRGSGSAWPGDARGSAREEPFRFASGLQMAGPRPTLGPERLYMQRRYGPAFEAPCAKRSPRSPPRRASSCATTTWTASRSTGWRRRRRPPARRRLAASMLRGDSSSRTCAGEPRHRRPRDRQPPSPGDEQPRHQPSSARRERPLNPPPSPRLPVDF